MVIARYLFNIRYKLITLGLFLFITFQLTNNYTNESLIHHNKNTNTIDTHQDPQDSIQLNEHVKQNIKEIQNDSNVFSSQQSNGQCDPVNHTFQQHSIKLAGATYPQYLLRNQNYSHNFECLNSSSKTPVILAWNKFYGETNFGYGLGKVRPFANRNCPVTNCELTMDKSRLAEADYVIVHMSDQFSGLPRERNEKTRWVWMLIESPYYTRTFENLNGLFNYTSDFLYESEFGSNYESQKRFLWAKNETFNDKHDYHANRPGFMSALISNCGAATRRLQFIGELKKHVQVEIYGKCGKPCPSEGDCREYVGAKYKFYFSFENSLCRDYITEKFFLMLKYDTIPVVFGAGNYSRFIPKCGYIDAQDYKSPEHLATYLKYLDSNVTAYNEYFQWKKHVNFVDKMVDYGMICDMCVELHLEQYYGVRKNVINDFNKYWNRQEQCRSAAQIPILKNLNR